MLIIGVGVFSSLIGVSHFTAAAYNVWRHSMPQSPGAVQIDYLHYLKSASIELDVYVWTREWLRDVHYQIRGLRGPIVGNERGPGC